MTRVLRKVQRSRCCGSSTSKSLLFLIPSFSPGPCRFAAGTISVPGNPAQNDGAMSLSGNRSPSGGRACGGLLNRRRSPVLTVIFFKQFLADPARQESPRLIGTASARKCCEGFRDRIYCPSEVVACPASMTNMTPRVSYPDFLIFTVRVTPATFF
jgi:hypothetical protein